MSIDVTTIKSFYFHVSFFLNKCFEETNVTQQTNNDNNDYRPEVNQKLDELESNCQSGSMIDRIFPDISSSLHSAPDPPEGNENHCVKIEDEELAQPLLGGNKLFSL